MCGHIDTYMYVSPILEVRAVLVAPPWGRWGNQGSLKDAGHGEKLSVICSNMQFLTSKTL